MKKFLFLFLFIGLVFSSQVECFRPPVVSCEGAKSIITCMWDNEGIYYGSGAGLIVNLIYDLHIHLKEGEVCSLDLKNGVYQSNVKVFMISGGPNAQIILNNATISPLHYSGYYGIFVTPGVKKVTLKDMTIYGFRSFVGGHGLSLVGSHELYTDNVRIYNNGIGIATSGSLYWVSKDTYVFGNSIGLWVDRALSGDGQYSTWICDNTIDVDIEGVLDLVGKSFRADWISPWRLGGLFEGCEGFSPPTSSTPPSNSSCPDIATAVAKANIESPDRCIVTNNSEYLVNYHIYSYEEGKYTLLQLYDGGSNLLDASYLGGYKIDSKTTTLKRGLNRFVLDVVATNSNECGKDTKRDVDYACVIYQPANCSAYVDSVMFNEQNMENLSEFTIYMHSPAYLNVSAIFSGNYSSCSLYIDGLEVATINSSETTLNKELMFNEEGDYSILLSCQQDPCNTKQYTLHVRKGNKICDNGVDIVNMPSSSCVVVRNISSFTASIYARSENVSSHLNIYLNGNLISSSEVNGVTSLSVPFSTSTYGQYNVYAEISGGQCTDSDFGCIIVEPPKETCNINLDGILPNGVSYVSGHNPERFAFSATSNYNLQCEFYLNNSLIYSTSGTDVSYDQTYLLPAGQYNSRVVCYAPSEPSCSKTLEGDLTLYESNSTCDLTVSANLPFGSTNKSMWYVFWNATASQDIRCIGLLNSTQLYDGLNYNNTFNLTNGQYYWQLYCYQIDNASCNARYESRLNISLDSPAPEACYLYLYGELPSGTYTNNTTQTLWYTAVSNTPMECYVLLNGSMLDNRNNVFSSSFNFTETYGMGNYLFEVYCSSLTDNKCSDSRISTLYVVNDTAVPFGACNITLNAELPSGTYDSNWTGYVNISSNTICNLSINNTLIATFNASFFQNYSFGVGDYLFSVVCWDPANDACIDSAASSLHINLANHTVPGNVTCNAEVSFRDLPNTVCVITNEGDGYLVSYTGYVSQNATLDLYFNENRIKRKHLNVGYFSGNTFVDLLNGTNTFMVRVDAGVCGAVDSGCVFLKANTSTTCDIGVSSTATLQGNQLSYYVSVYNKSSCVVILDNALLDSFNVSNIFTNTYYLNLTQGNHTLKITCVEDSCKNTSILSVNLPDICEATAYIEPSTCQVFNENATISYVLYSNHDYTYSVWIGSYLVDTGSGWGIYNNTIKGRFASGVYPLYVDVNGTCNAQARGCIIVKNNCTEGLNITLNNSGYIIEGSRGQCRVYANNVEVGIFDYEDIAHGNISGNWSRLTIACEDELYCPNSKTISNQQLSITILDNSSGLKLTPDHNTTSLEYILYGENATCKSYLDNKLLEENFEREGVHFVNASFDHPGIYEFRVVCNTSRLKTSAYKQILVYYTTTNDTISPNILLVYPPNNTLWMYFPQMFVFVPLDDQDPMLDCRLNVYNKDNRIIYTVKGTFSMGKRAYVISKFSPRIFEKDKYYWNVTCVDNGDPVGYSDTWIFRGLDNNTYRTTSNFIYPNQTIYEGTNVKIYYGVNSTYPEVNTTIILNDVTIVPWIYLDSNVLYASYISLPPGDYNATIISYVNGTYITNKTTFKVLIQNDTKIFYNNLSSDKDTYIGNESIYIYYNVTHNLQSIVNSTLFLNDDVIFTGNLTSNVTYKLMLELPSGNYTATLISVDESGEIAESSVQFEVLLSNKSLIFANYVESNQSKYITNDTADVSIMYGVSHSAQSSVYSELYLNDSLLINGSLLIDRSYNMTLELAPGTYDLLLISKDNGGNVVYASGGFLVVGVKKEKEKKQKEVDKTVLAKLIPGKKEKLQSKIFSVEWGGLGALVAGLLVGGLLWFLWRKKTVIIELLEEPHVSKETSFIVKTKTGGPVKNALLIVVDPEGKEEILITDENGVAKFIPKVAGVYTVKPVKFKPAPESVTEFMVK